MLRAALLGAVALVAVVARDARAEDVVVPESLQAELVGKMAAYDRSFAARAGERAHVLIFDKPDDAGSARAAAHLEAAFHALSDVGGLPHDEEIVAWPGVATLAQVVKAR